MLKVAAADTENHFTPILRDYLLGMTDLGHKTEYFPTERHTISACNNKGFDIVFTVGEVNQREFEQFKKQNPQTRIIHAVDSFRPDLVELKGVIDFLITSQISCPPLTKQYADCGVSLYNVPLAGNDHLFYPIDEEEKYDFSFIGGLCHGPRGLEHRFYPYINTHRVFLGGHVYGNFGVHSVPHPYCNVIRNQTKINLNGHVSYQKEKGLREDWNQSLINICLSGGFQIVDFPRALEVFEGNVPVPSDDDFHEVATYYLNNDSERKEMAFRAREIALRNHTWKTRMAELLQIIEKHEATRP